jgi:hypothetical protein
VHQYLATIHYEWCTSKLANDTSLFLHVNDHVQEIRGRKQRKDIGKCSCVNMTIKIWNKLPAKVLGIYPCKHKTCRKRVRKAIISGVK